MQYNQLICTADNGIFTITINRADKMNALNREVLSEIRQAMKQAGSDNNVHGIIITGAGEKAFVAGADIAEFAGFNQAQGKEMGEYGHATLNLIEQSAKPVIAAVNGFALGGGCELAMACHMRVASNNARFGQPEVNLGIIPGYGGTQRLVRLIGQGKAMELILTGDTIKAEEALQLGLVNHVVETSALLDKCHEILNKIIGKAPLAIAKAIKCMNAYDKKDVDAFQLEIVEFGRCFNTSDVREGTSAFLEKRKPEFTGN